MPSPLVEKREELASKQKALADIFEQAGPDIDLSKVKTLSGSTTDRAAEIKRLNTELGDLGKEVEALAEVERTAEQVKAMGDRLNAPATRPTHASGKGRGEEEQKSIGELFTGSVAYKNRGGDRSPTANLSEVDVKTLFATSAGWAPESTRNGRVELTPESRLAVSDLPMMTETSQATVKYMEETTFTSGAAETSEGGSYGEAALALTEKSSDVRKIAVFLPITDEQLEDEPHARDYVNNRLTRMLRARTNSQSLVGNGSAPNLRGILNTSGILTQAKGSDPVPDAIYKGITKVRFTGYAEPDAAVFHPNDWQDIRLTRTADGIYIWGNPSEPGMDRIWGLAVVVDPAETENTALVGSFRDYCEMALRRGIEFQITNSHSTYFTEGKQAVRADFRMALVVYRPKAFCTVTGI